MGEMDGYYYAAVAFVGSSLAAAMAALLLMFAFGG